MNEFRQQGDRFSGILSNKPQLVRNVREGQRITFDRSEIGDWMYLQDGKIRGNYTGCVLRAKATPEELKEWESFPPLVCD